MIEVLSNGALNLVQDSGRAAHIGTGVCRSGAIDLPALRLANMLVGNDQGAAGIEITIFPFRVKVLRATSFACTGALTSVALPHRQWPSWWSGHAEDGQVITVAAPQEGSRAMLAFGGGVDVRPILGSRSTDLKSGFGGHEGRGLRKGDQLPLGEQSSRNARSLGVVPASRTKFFEQLRSGAVIVRALPTAEFSQFTQEARAAFESAEFKLTTDCNRQGYRLEGPMMKTVNGLELLSHPVVPGVVQVPPSGQPIVQMAEANTIGGYPKIATVIEVDLWRLAQLRPGQRVRFALIDHAQSLEAEREAESEISRLRESLALMAMRP